MRRGSQALLMVTALAALAPSAFGQYPYPSAPPGYGPPPYAPPGYGPMPYALPSYGPMPYAPPGYGPMPMPMYGQPMMPMPYYRPAPMPQPPRPTVYVYGPLTDPDASPPRRYPVQLAPVKPAPQKFAPAAPRELPAPAKAPGVSAKFDDPKKAGTGVRQVQAMLPPGEPMQPLAIRRVQYDLPDSCGVYGCGESCPDAGCCEAACCPRPPLHGHGHWIGEVGAYFLVPHSSSRAAYMTTDPADRVSTTDFPQNAVFGPRISLGYIFHNTWGFRADYWNLTGRSSTSVGNADPNTLVETPMDFPFKIVSPGLALQQGIGADQFSFQQRLDINVADVEVLKEWQWMDTTFLWSVGGRYARVLQSYTATRNNPGGTNGLVTVNIDRDNLDASSNFEGWGPTASFEVMHLLGKSNFSTYANVRGSWLWGVNRFSQTLGQQQASVDNTGVPTFFDSVINGYAQSHREVTLLEAECGLQYGCRFGRCYVFGRAGAVYQRWFDVGTPTTPDGSLTFVGGTARLGITY